MTDPAAQSCSYSRCKAHHLLDPVLAYVHQLTPAQLTQFYADAVGELLLSLREDVKSGRRASYLTRLRLSMECYMKGFWVGLVATPDEVVHDASGEQPFLSIEKLSRIVFSQVLGQQVMPSFSFKTPNRMDLSVYDLLNISTHMTAYAIVIAHFVTDEQFGQMYSPIDKLIMAHARTLQNVSRQFLEGKSRKQIITDLRQSPPK